MTLEEWQKRFPHAWTYDAPPKAPRLRDRLLAVVRQLVAADVWKEALQLRRLRKLRRALPHVAAALLAGWYLMSPPVGNGGIGFNAPLSQWVYEGSFDSAATCAAQRDADMSKGVQLFLRYRALSPSEQAEVDAKFARKENVSLEVAHAFWLHPDWVEAEQCLANDDPRLRS